MVGKQRDTVKDPSPFPVLVKDRVWSGKCLEDLQPHDGEQQSCHLLHCAGCPA